MNTRKGCGCSNVRLCPMHRGAAKRRQYFKHGHENTANWDANWSRPKGYQTLMRLSGVRS